MSIDTCQRRDKTKFFLALMFLLIAGLLLVMAPQPAEAAAGSYTLKWFAADPALNSGQYDPTYDKVLPGDAYTQQSFGSDCDPMQDAVLFTPL